MVKTVSTLAAVVGVLCFGFLASPAAIASDAEIRFYKINKKSQQSEIYLIRNRDKPGCHNLRRARDVFRIAQVGFVYCSIYLRKDCEEGYEYTMIWKGKTKKNSIRSQPTERAMPGDMWFFKNNRIQEMRSWKCE